MFLSVRAWLCIAVVLALSQAASAAEPVAPAVYHRTVFLGDSITDGDTYPKLVRDALAAAGLPKMISINAGIGGDTAHGMQARLERDVLAFHPTLVTLSAGANDAGRVTPEAYERDVRAIAERLQRERIPLLLLTPNIVGPKFSSKQHDLDAYEAALRRIAKDFALRIAELNDRQRHDVAAGRPLLAADDLHPNWEGQRSIARAVLGAMGYGKLSVSEEIANDPLPGLITPWKIRRLDPKEPPLSATAIARLQPDASWLTLKLPETERMTRIDSDSHWFDGYRAQGASVALLAQPAGKFVGVAELASERGGKLQFHMGGELEQVWLNGRLIYENNSVRGYHIGRESVAAELQPGKNQIAIRTGTVFFLSATPGPMWEE